MSDERRGVKHQIIIERREKCFITGVNDVVSFDEEAIVADTDMGVMVIRGQNLHVNKLNLEEGELCVDGEIYNVSYEDEGYGKGKSFLNKIFK